MKPSTTPDSPTPPSTTDGSENDLQPFFILHKTTPQKGDRKVNRSTRTKRKIDLSTASPKSARKFEANEQVEEDVDHHYEQLRTEAFDNVWSKIEMKIKEVLRNINSNVFSEVHHWISQSFLAIRASGKPSFSQMNCPYPFATDISSRQISTAMVFTKNVEFVDDLVTFEELGAHLRSHGCHVAKLSSPDFLGKHGLGGCLRSLLRQLLMVMPDSADIAILASWYCEPENSDSPLVVIIDDMERCNGSVLSDFILMLSDWAVKLPIILIMGISTTTDAPRNLLTSNALQHLRPCKFTLGSPAGKLDAIIEAILVKEWLGFDIGHKVAIFLRNYFSKQDGTVTSFVRALKIACAKHFMMEPLSFLCEGFTHEDFQDFWTNNCASLPESMLRHAFDLPSCESSDESSILSGESLAFGLSQMKKLRKEWSSVLLCLYEVAKLNRVPLLDIFCEALDKESYNLLAEAGENLGKLSSVNYGLNVGENSDVRKGVIIQVLCKVRNLSAGQLRQLLQAWSKHTEEISEVHGKVNELESMLENEDDGKSQKHDEPILRRYASRGYFNLEDNGRVNEKAAALIECMVKNYLKPIERLPFHEIVCFKNVNILKSALIGDPRRTIQVDLLKSYNYIHCNCCSKTGNALLPSMHDTSIMYTLAQEHGDLINLPDWFQSFKSTVLCSSPMGKRKMHSSSLQERNQVSEPEYASEASLQARFCRAVTELQITGLLRMPSKRRPDYVQRVAFGL